jgi:hypothetical protein
MAARSPATRLIDSSSHRGNAASPAPRPTIPLQLPFRTQTAQPSRSDPGVCALFLWGCTRTSASDAAPKGPGRAAQTIREATDRHPPKVTHQVAGTANSDPDSNRRRTAAIDRLTDSMPPLFLTDRPGLRQRNGRTGLRAQDTSKAADRPGEMASRAYPSPNARSAYQSQSLQEYAISFFGGMHTDFFLLSSTTQPQRGRRPRQLKIASLRLSIYI